jgi:hypothetical protein
MSMTLSCDHLVVDGALGAELLRQLSFPASVVAAVARQYAHPAEPVERQLYVGRLVRACAYEAPTLDPMVDVLREFNLAHKAAGAIKYGQSQLDISDEMDLEADRARYQADRAKDLLLEGERGIDAALK